MISARKIAKAIQDAVNAPPFETANDLRAVFDILNKADISWHPDDDLTDIVWSIPITERQTQVLSAIADRLHVESDRFNLDIYNEMMESHVRVHGKDSCFYPEHLPADQREYMGFWGDGYTDDCTIKHEVVGASLFSEDNGYDDWMIADVLALDIGERYEMNDLCGEHWVVRIK